MTHCAILQSKGFNMAKRVVRIVINEETYRDFRIICAERNTSIPKMTTHLLMQFIQHDAAIKKTLSELKKEK